MIRVSILATIIGLTLTACGGSGAGGATPEAAFENLKNAVINKDYAAVYDSMAPSRKQQREDQWNKQMEGPQGKKLLERMSEKLGVPADEIKNMSSREFFIKMMSKMSEDPSVVEEIKKMQESSIVETKIDGNHAQLRIKFGGRVNTMKFIKVDGVWYLDEKL